MTEEERLRFRCGVAGCNHWKDNRENTGRCSVHFAMCCRDCGVVAALEGDTCYCKDRCHGGELDRRIAEFAIDLLKKSSDSGLAGYEPSSFGGLRDYERWREFQTIVCVPAAVVAELLASGEIQTTSSSLAAWLYSRPIRLSPGDIIATTAPLGPCKVDGCRQATVRYCSRISSRYCNLHQSSNCENCPVVAARDGDVTDCSDCRGDLLRKKALELALGFNEPPKQANQISPTSEKKHARELGSEAFKIAFKKSDDRQRSRTVLVLLYIGFCFIGLVVGQAKGMEIAALIAVIGATWFVPMLIADWGHGPAMKEYNKGNSYLQQKDYRAAIGAYNKAIGLGNNPVSSAEDPAQQDPRDQFDDGGW